MHATVCRLAARTKIVSVVARWPLVEVGLHVLVLV